MQGATRKQGQQTFSTVKQDLTVEQLGNPSDKAKITVEGYKYKVLKRHFFYPIIQELPKELSWVVISNFSLDNFLKFMLLNKHCNGLAIECFKVCYYKKYVAETFQRSQKDAQAVYDIMHSCLIRKWNESPEFDRIGQAMSQEFYNESRPSSNIHQKRNAGKELSYLLDCMHKSGSQGCWEETARLCIESIVTSAQDACWVFPQFVKIVMWNSKVVKQSIPGNFYGRMEEFYRESGKFEEFDGILRKYILIVLAWFSRDGLISEGSISKAFIKDIIASIENRNLTYFSASVLGWLLHQGNITVDWISQKDIESIKACSNINPLNAKTFINIEWLLLEIHNRKNALQDYLAEAKVDQIESEIQSLSDGSGIDTILLEKYGYINALVKLGKKVSL